MRTIAFLLGALLCGEVARATEQLPLIPAAPPLVGAQERLHVGKQLTYAGVASFVAGVLMVGAGAGLILDGLPPILCFNNCRSGNDAELAGGILSTVLGYSGFFTGIGLMAAGQTKIRHAKKAMRLSAGVGGLSLQF